MTRRLILLRHGQTTWNAGRRIQGQLGTEFDETGELQAKTAAPVVAALAPATIWSSDLSRARRTAEVAGEACGLTPVLDPRLREFHLGERQGLTHAEYGAAAPEEFARFARGAWRGIPGAETPEQVGERYAAALTDLAATLGPEETGVAVSHGAAIRTGLVAFLGWPVEVAGDLKGLGICQRVELAERGSGGWLLVGYGLPADR